MNRIDIKRHTQTCNSAWDISNTWRNIKYLGAWDSSVIILFSIVCVSYICVISVTLTHTPSFLTSPLSPLHPSFFFQSPALPFPAFLFCMASEFGVSCLRFFTGARATHQWLHHWRKSAPLQPQLIANSPSEGPHGPLNSVRGNGEGLNSVLALCRSAQHIEFTNAMAMPCPETSFVTEGGLF